MRKKGVRLAGAGKADMVASFTCTRDATLPDGDCDWRYLERTCQRLLYEPRMAFKMIYDNKGRLLMFEARISHRQHLHARLRSLSDGNEDSHATSVTEAPKALKA